MRIVTATILLLSLLANCFSTYLIQLDYACNKQFITANLCINKNRPELKCEGRCYLCRKLNKDNNKEQETPGRTTQFKFLLLSIQQHFEFTSPDSQSHVRRFGSFAENLPRSIAGSIFHPPQG